MSDGGLVAREGEMIVIRSTMSGGLRIYSEGMLEQSLEQQELDDEKLYTAKEVEAITRRVFYSSLRKVLGWQFEEVFVGTIDGNADGIAVGSVYIYDRPESVRTRLGLPDEE